MEIVITESQYNRVLLKEQGNTKLDFCKKNVNNDLLLKAKTWWKNWLNNSSSKERFRKTFNYNQNQVERHFAVYNNIINKVKMEYVFQLSNPNHAWVMDGSPYNSIIVNCLKTSKSSPSELESLLIHEIQHLLGEYHKFYPYQDDEQVELNSGEWVDKKGLFPIPNDWEGLNPGGKGALKTHLISQGFKQNVNEIIDEYIWYLENDVAHLRNSTEILSSLNQVRKLLNLRPDQKITKEMLINNSDEEDIIVFICQWLYSKKTLSDFLNFSNSIAMGKSNTTDRNLA